MLINDILAQQHMTKYALAKKSGVALTTVADICSGKSRLENCSSGTLNRIAKTLGVTMEMLLHGHTEYRPSFEIFKSNVCHQVKDMGDLPFIISTLETGRIVDLWEKGWHAECLYLLAMVDYLSQENDLPLCRDYAAIRRARLSELLYPTGILLLSKAVHSDAPKRESLREAIPEFLRFNIVESDVRNVV